MSAVWDNMALPQGARQGGTLNASIGQRLDGGPEFHVTLETRGTLDPRRWDGRVELAGGGPSWSDVTVRLSAPRLRVDGKHTVSLDGLTVDLHLAETAPSARWSWRPARSDCPTPTA